jgi:hypothetical protein
LRFIPQSLRRTVSTPHSAGFARLELGLFTKPSDVMTFYDFIFIDRHHKRHKIEANGLLQIPPDFPFSKGGSTPL